jgi:hypothetical protein
MKRTLRTLFVGLAALLLGGAASAQSAGPQGVFFAGVGGSVGSATSLSLDLQIETPHFVYGTALSFTADGITADQSITLFWLRAAYVLTESTKAAPYLGLGLAFGELGPILESGHTSADYLVPEAGLLLLRGNRFGHVSIYANAPLPATTASFSDSDLYCMTAWKRGSRPFKGLPSGGCDNAAMERASRSTATP